jgi:wobble nucleotide-excising tRNase
VITELNIDAVTSYKSLSSINPINKTCLMYGLNGAGKSTISEYLYNPTNPLYNKCSIKQNPVCEMLVYNQSFLNDYFYEEDSLKGIFTLSKENKSVLQQVESESKNLEALLTSQVQKAEDISTISTRIEQEKSKASSKTWEIKTKYSGGDRVLEFCLDGLKRTEPLFQHISSLKLPSEAPKYTIEELKTEMSLIEGDGAVHLSTISTLVADWLDIETNPLFTKVIVGSQEGSVAEFIGKLGNSDWVKQGLRYINLNGSQEPQTCPFCQEPTITNNIAKSISDVFDEAYELDVADIETLQRKYDASASRISFQDISLLPISNKELEDAWALATESLKATLRENVLLISNKLKSPSSSITLNDSRNAIDSINETISTLNNLITIHNDNLTNKKLTANNIKSRFWTLMRWDYDQSLSIYSDAVKDLEEEARIASEEARDIDEAVESSKLKIADLRKQTVNIEESIQSINIALVDIGIDGFSVVKYGDSLYRIARSGDNANAFHSLSEGEKTVISFLYFIELCKGQKTASSVPLGKIVVIDDPISSLSHLYVFNIGQLIKKSFINNQLYKQVFILTHSLYFFYELTQTNKETRDKTQQLYRIIKNGQGSSVIPMRYEEIQNDYQSYWSIVNDPSTPPALIANCMRNIIEYFFNFVQKKDFNNVFQSPALSADKFKTFYRYMNRESHSLGQNIFDIKEFDHQTFKDGLKTIFDECGYLEHYIAMTK